MIFEQAFYSRDQKGGLGIYAASDTSRSFLVGCEAVGGIFRMEDLKAEHIAEVVYYSDVFSRYVGVGITATTYEDGTGRNRIVHILVPVEDSADPSDCCLDYAFESRFEWGKKYPQLELGPAVGTEEYHTILDRYGLTAERLARLLFLLLRVVTGKKSRIMVVAEESRVPGTDLRRTAREIMWLLHTLLPVPEAERRLYRKNLSYCVHSTTNTDRVNVAFVTAAPAQEPYFDLTSDGVADAAEAEPPEVYRKLAEYALLSLEEYRTFLEDLFTCRLDRTVSPDSMERMFLFWKLQKGEVKELDSGDLPCPLADLITEAANGDRYRAFLYKILQVLCEAGVRDLRSVYEKVFTKEFSDYTKEGVSPDLIPAYCSAMRLAYARKERYGNEKAYGFYTTIPNEEMRSAVLSELWTNGGEESCILKDIGDISAAADFAEKAARYAPLQQDAQFEGRMKQILLEKDLYFLMDKGQRESAAAWLDSAEGDSVEKTFSELIRERAAALFQESPGKYSKFLENEINRMESRFIPLYFGDLVDKCGLAKNDEDRKLLQQTGYKYLKRCGQEIPEKDRGRFKGIDSVWRRNDFKRRLQGLSLEKLAGFRDFQDDSREEARDFYSLWLEEVLQTAREEGRIQDNILTVLVDRRQEVEEHTSASQFREYEETLWNLCGDSLSQRAYCSAHLGPHKYRIWSLIPVFHIDGYAELGDYVRDQRQICTVSIPDYPEEDFNRECYGLWEAVEQDGRIDSSNLNRLWGYAQSYGRSEGWDLFLEELIETIRGREERISLQTCSNYLNLYHFLYKESSGRQRCAHYAELRQKYASFYSRMLDIENSLDRRQMGTETGRRLSEICLFEKVASAASFTEASLCDKAALLFEAEEHFGPDVPEIVGLRKECDDKTMELNEKKERLEESIRNRTNAIEQNRTNIRQKQEEIDSLHKQIAEMESESRDYQSCIEKEENQLAEIENILRNAEYARKGQPYVHQPGEEARRTDLRNRAPGGASPSRDLSDTDVPSQVPLYEGPSYEEDSRSGRQGYRNRRAEEAYGSAETRERSGWNGTSPSDREEYRNEIQLIGNSSRRKKSGKPPASDSFSSDLQTADSVGNGSCIITSQYEVSFPSEL